ncbi:MAG TPA: ABC transporter ATP-binding protein [Methanomassiliicoccales archaeon]|nr:ABC transporter ATP-binding protein [Methanomassiliicoccales archaeon]
MSEPVVSLRSVSFSYPDGHAALESVSLDVYPGESVAIIGPNGAGKSTLLQVIAGLVPATDGTVRVCGKEIDRRSIDRPHDLDWLRVKLGIVFQDSDVALFSSSVWNDVTFGPLHMGLSPADVVARGNAALDALGISHLKDRAPYRLSGGEKRKVSISSVLSIQPEIILFDEPTSDLDPRSRKSVIDILKRLSGEGKTVIVATHDVNAVPDFAKRIVVLKRNLIACGSVRDVLSDEALLDRANLDVPEVTHLFRVLSSCGYHTSELPFSIDEAVDAIMKRGDRFHIHESPHT